ncbi:hypothetical protein LSUCC0031_02035 [Rhodobacterales bacterium LSUCC0031]|nr:hypothetical protein [Rhodobacterales bacterium LSUCC0031]
MTENQNISGPVVLILGSGPAAVAVRGWNRSAFDQIVAINNAWRLRPDWDVSIHPEDFPPEHRPPAMIQGQSRIVADDYVPIQNAYGGFVYAGGTMAFTAGYWALGALKPRVMAFFGCDMVYATTGKTHFYGTGTADPLRADITLQSLEAKAARLQLLAAERGCACVNLSMQDSRLVFPRADLDELAALSPVVPDTATVHAAKAREAALGYMVPSGRYWQEADRFDAAALADLDALWLAAHAATLRTVRLRETASPSRYRGAAASGFRRGA